MKNKLVFPLIEVPTGAVKQQDIPYVCAAKESKSYSFGTLSILWENASTKLKIKQGKLQLKENM